MRRAEASEEVKEIVRRRLAQEPDGDLLMEALGLVPYRAARTLGDRGYDQHGSVMRYRDRGCRCDPCVAAGTAERGVKHGTVNRYRELHCRCAPCVAAGVAKIARDTERDRRRRTAIRQEAAA